jgi:hypothetical protein
MEEEKSKGKKQTKIDNMLVKSTVPSEFTREGVCVPWHSLWLAMTRYGSSRRSDESLSY